MLDAAPLLRLYRRFARLPLGLEALEIVVEGLLVGAMLLHRLRRLLLTLRITLFPLLGSEIHAASN